jgi:hypothetical protein
VCRDGLETRKKRAAEFPLIEKRKKIQFLILLWLQSVYFLFVLTLRTHHALFQVHRVLQSSGEFEKKSINEK